MTEQDWIDLGRRAVACAGWRWMPGMLARYEGDAWCRVTEGNSFGCPTRVRPPNPRQAWPDFRDPATRGCVMALVDELRLGVDTRTAADEVRADALVAALEVADD